MSEAQKPAPVRIDKEFYDRSDYFEGHTEHITNMGSPFQRYRIANVLRIYDPGEDQRVLDLGCGWGTFDFTLAPRVTEMVGVDFSEKSIAICNRGLAKRPRANLSFICADAGDTGLAESHFDLVIAADLFEHLYPQDTKRVIAEAWRVLKPGGRLSIWTPHRGHVLERLRNNNVILKRDVSHVDYKSMERMEEYLRVAGFALEKAYYVESHLPVLRWFERNFMGWLPFLRRRIAILVRKTSTPRT